MPIHRHFRRVASAGLLVLAWPAMAAQEDRQLWLQANTNLPLKRTSRLTFEQIGRFSDRLGGAYTSEFGVLFGYRPSPNVELGFGYRYVDFYNGNTARAENRIRQQVVAGFGPVTMRFRIDERFHPEGSEIGIRIRPLVRYNHRIRKDGLALFVSHESFFLPNSTAWGQRAGYERMRNIVGIVLPIAKGVSGDLGYLNQYRFARGGSQAQINHACSFQLNINLPTLGIHKVDD